MEFRLNVSSLLKTRSIACAITGGSRGRGPGACPRWRPGNIMHIRPNSKPIQLQQNLSFIISGYRKWPHLAIISIHVAYCENGLQMENKSKEILHNLSTQKDAKLCLKCIKIRLAAGLRPDLLHGELNLTLPQSLWPESRGSYF